MRTSTQQETLLFQSYFSLIKSRDILVNTIKEVTFQSYFSLIKSIYQTLAGFLTHVSFNPILVWLNRHTRIQRNTAKCSFQSYFSLIKSSSQTGRLTSPPARFNPILVWLNLDTGNWWELCKKKVSILF